MQIVSLADNSHEMSWVVLDGRSANTTVMPYFLWKLGRRFTWNLKSIFPENNNKKKSY